MMLAESTSGGGLGDGDVEYGDHSRVPGNPLVSVSMITYQHASYIKEALDSVLMQKVDFPYEICLGEDGSTDGTRDICIDYARRHPDKIRLFLRDRSNPARGSFRAPYMFNNAATFNACRGKYIAMLEGDDYWLHPQKLQLQVNDLERSQALAVSCHYAASVPEGRPWAGSVAPDYPVDSFTIKDILERDVDNLHTSTWLLRRGRPMEWEPFRSCSFGDYPILVSTLLRGTGRVLPGVWSLYRIHGQGVFSPLSYEIRLQKNVELWECLKSILPPPLGCAADIGATRALIMRAGELRKAGKYGLALACFRAALSEIGRFRPPPARRRELRLLALEALVIPHLAGIRRLWRKRRFRKRSGGGS